MKAYLILILSLFLVSCGNQTVSENKIKTEFKLETDISNSSELLNTGDTLNIGFDLSLCANIRYTNLSIVKRKSQVILNVREFGDFVDTNFSKTYPLAEFNLDSLLFTNIIDSLTIREVDNDLLLKKDRLISEVRLSFKDKMIHLEDTLGLNSKIKLVRKFEAIMHEEFPENWLYESLPVVSPPEPPKGD